MNKCGCTACATETLPSSSLAYSSSRIKYVTFEHYSRHIHTHPSTFLRTWRPYTYLKIIQNPHTPHTSSLFSAFRKVHSHTYTLIHCSIHAHRIHREYAQEWPARLLSPPTERKLLGVTATAHWWWPHYIRQTRTCTHDGWCDAPSRSTECRRVCVCVLFVWVCKVTRRRHTVAHVLERERAMAVRIGDTCSTIPCSSECSYIYSCVCVCTV